MLTYSIAREWLEGQIGTTHFSFHAWSGGGRGQKGSHAEHTSQSYDVFRKERVGVRGGPLPPGLYICRYVAHHPTFHECIFLEQTLTALLEVDASAHIRFYDRGGFYIHGRGPKGSDGCIVPGSEGDRHRLNQAVKHSTSAVLLKVTDLGMPLPASRETGVQFA